MGLSMGTVVADHELAEDELEKLGLELTGELASVADALSGDRAVVFTRETQNGICTVIADPEGEVSARIIEDQLNLPGTWFVAVTLSSAGYDCFRVVGDGELIRILESGQEGNAEEGTALFDESPFILPPEEDEDWELDGELLVQELPTLLGAFPSSDEYFAAVGEVAATGETLR